MIFVDQNILKLTFDTGSTIELVEKKILYKTPAGIKGSWTPTGYNGTIWEYQLTVNDKLIKGVYEFQTYGKDAANREIFGDIVKVQVQPNIK